MSLLCCMCSSKEGMVKIPPYKLEKYKGVYYLCNECSKKLKPRNIETKNEDLIQGKVD